MKRLASKRLASLALFGSLVLGALSCKGIPEAFPCTSNDACSSDGSAGFCEQSNVCSMRDATCPSGRRYVKEAGTLTEQCVAPWIFVAGGALAEVDPVLALDRQGKLHLGATFVDQTAVNGVVLASAGSSDFFLARLDAETGRVDAVERFGGVGQDELLAIARYGADSLLVAAGVDAPLVFDGVDVAGAGTLIARRGPRPWASLATARAGYAYPTSIAEDGSSGGVVVVGAIASFDESDADVTFGLDVEGDERYLVAPSTHDTESPEQGFIATYDAEGKIAAVSGARSDGTSGVCESLAVDPSGVFVTGCDAFTAADVSRETPLTLLQSNATWADSLVLSETVAGVSTGVPALASGGGSIFFLATSCEGSCQLPRAPDGTPGTVQTIASGPAALVVARVRVDEESDYEPITEWSAIVDLAGVEIYPESVAAGPDGRVYVAGGFLGSAPELAAVGQTDVFVATFDPAGALEKIESFGGASEDWADAIVVSDAGKVYVAGTFRGTASFRGLLFEAGDNDDVFLMQL